MATALCLSEAEIKAMTWTHYKALCKHWVKSPPTQFVLANWLKAQRR